MFESILFFGFVIVFFILPGMLLLRWANMITKKGVALVLALGTGMSLFTYLSFIIRSFEGPYTGLYIYGLMIIILALVYRKDLHSSLPHIYRKNLLFWGIALGILIFCVIALSYAHLQSGITSEGLKLVAARDSLWRLSIVAELIHHFPPKIPGFPPMLLKNYHYLYDLLVASTSALTGIEIVSLYTRWYVLLLSFFLVFASWVLVSQLTTNRWIALIGTFLTMLTGNLSYLMPFFSSQYDFVAKADLFMSNQPFDQSHNPFNLLAYALFLTILLLIKEWERRKSWRAFLLAGICLGVLPGIKIYGGVLAMVALIGVMIYLLATLKKVYWYMILPFILFLPIFIAMKGDGFNILAFNPGWLLRKMVEDQDRLFLPEFILKEEHYRQTGNILRLGFLKLELLLIYLVGNLNIRILTFGVVIPKIRSRKITPLFGLFAALAIVTALSLPLLFSQNRGVYDSIQFTPYGLLLLSIFTVIVIEQLLYKLYRRGKWLLAAIGTFMLVGIAIPTNIMLFIPLTPTKQYLIAHQELKALTFLKAASESDAIILSDLDEDKLVHMYIPALSQRRTFLAGTSLTEQTGVNTASRQREIRDFFLYNPQEIVDRQTKETFLKQNKIDFIYLSGSGFSHRALLDKLELLLIYEETDVVIYKVI